MSWPGSAGRGTAGKARRVRVRPVDAHHAEVRRERRRVEVGVGEPAQSLMFYSMQLFRQAFVYFNMGRATAMAWVLFLVILLLSFVIFRTSGWVHYGGEEKR